MAKVRIPYNIVYVDYRIVDVRGSDRGSAWNTIVAFSSEEEAREAAKVLAEKLRLHNPCIAVFGNKVIIKKYVLEWKILWALKGD
ncbi:MAG: hypothetical protein DRN49_01295 [Thaumarchaeota archaeon]|nr:MAG: hypothetical protein DRN49_01295 [Nitrososphaerota archaeon]